MSTCHSRMTVKQYFDELQVQHVDTALRIFFFVRQIDYMFAHLSSSKPFQSQLTLVVSHATVTRPQCFFFYVIVQNCFGMYITQYGSTVYIGIAMVYPH